MRIAAVAVILCVAALAAPAADPLLLSTRRDGWLEAFRLDTLETAARVRIKPRAEGVLSSPDGQRFFVRAPHVQAPEVCCALFGLDARAMRAFAILWPSLEIAEANGRLFTQRGDEGVEVFDARTMGLVGTLSAPGIFRLAPSPDGRWLFGAKPFPNPAVDVFDVAAMKLVRHIPVPDGGQDMKGVWVGAQYYLFAPGLPGAGRLWAVSPQTESLGSPKLFRLGGAACAEPDYDALAAGDRIAVYSPVGTKLAGECMSGGYVLADPAEGGVSARLSPDLHLVRLISGPDGKSLYGLAEPEPPAIGVRLVKIEAASGQIKASRALPADVWTISIGTIPAEWQGRLDLHAVFQ